MGIMKKKKMSQKSRRQFKQVLDHYYQSREDKQDIDAEIVKGNQKGIGLFNKILVCLLYTSPSPRDA